MSALRLIEDEAARGRGSLLTLRCSQEAAFYVLNRKRADIAEIESRYGVLVEIIADGEEEGARMTVEANGPPPAYAPKFDAPLEEPEDDLVEEELEDEELEEEVETDVETVRDEDGDRNGRGRHPPPARTARSSPRGRGSRPAPGPEDVAEEQSAADFRSTTARKPATVTAWPRTARRGR
ncbi:hypothetical protein AB5I41_15620 [Sphingomonas sp. MMS24-JH45]